MGMVFAKIYPKPGQTPHEALTEALNKVKPNFADQILKDPTPQEVEEAKLRRMAWAMDPKGYNKLTTRQPTNSRACCSRRRSPMPTSNPPSWSRPSPDTRRT
jgi:hypothetical protein